MLGGLPGRPDLDRGDAFLQLPLHDVELPSRVGFERVLKRPDSGEPVGQRRNDEGGEKVSDAGRRHFEERGLISWRGLDSDIRDLSPSPPCVYDTD